MEGYIGCCFFSSSGYRYLGHGDTYRSEILHDGTCVFRMSFLPWGGGRSPKGSPKSQMFGLNFDHFNREYLEKCKSQRYMSIIA